MPAARTLLSSTTSKRNYVDQTFDEHCSGDRVETRNKVLTSLRSTYPDFHITEVDEAKCSLFEFAAADKATLALDAEDEKFKATRKWVPVGEGVEKKMHPGDLIDHYRFARFQYIWQDHEFIVYYVTWADMLKSMDKVFYILYPRSSGSVANGHCPETDALILAAGKWTSQLHSEIFVFDDGCWDKSKELWKAVSGSSWADVILNPTTKQSLIEDVMGFFDNRELYASYGVPWKRGIILHGVPGNGKTVSIKALMNALYAREDAIPSLYIKSLSTQCNTEQYAISEIFKLARSQAPCLLIFEDLDSLVKDETRSYFLNEVDGLESNDGILMIGSTNHLNRLDPAIAKRPSRFDRKYHFKIPELEERKAYAKYWRSKLVGREVEFPEDVVDVVAEMTEGFSFAYLKELFVMALLGLVRGATGEDEDVNAEQAADEDKEKDNEEEKPEEKKEEEKEEELCTCTAKCATCHKSLPPTTSSSETKKKTDEAVEADEEAALNNMVLPTVEIPAHLKDNVLLKVIRHQIRILHAEMDNTKEENWPGEKTSVKGGNSNAEFAQAIARARRRRARMC
ncbi:SpoVK ATPase of the AAA+ class [Pyrenophora tritici-repentis]|uniref:Proteasome-activating nucleotidase n=2 Tax=Pyrenophora tritici-repentis TaxID=45151 RepID=A0A2W1EE78_9PLEO|nr:proteasome-activating nucleotidase [Pyrenophora tritici-repentis Pt-1C-BFP]KAA8612505.1 Proteasome-activating nucleotidase [Pyrenophora tritici-repentis]EDU47638.1 proteasome-activating nucleotidase [Pyrenophora tritici-repentis Pt-1C-BFP]KAF7446968.1 Proteasome-activating nucleotidase [Pyrenophora tritici-repentis]KAF7569252.1 SpoVK, ATPase AAA+ class [Pyrenophora tritici-repentis]KAG9382970.1 Proteasome-activating nucleotidase [Pyrenophora tritici-repentis]